MKKVMKSLSVMLLMVALGMSFGSCSSDSDNLALLLATAGTSTVSPADPEGTIVVNVSSGSYASLSFYSIVFTNEYFQASLMGMWPAQIVSVGPVAGLGFINTIPQEGWNYRVAVQVGNGYIIRSDRVAGYIRFYVVGYNDVGGITIKYQDWNGPQQ